MATELRLKTKVLPGKRIELTAPELVEGEIVDVYLTVPDGNKGEAQSVRDYLRSLPRSPRTLEEWAQYENELQAERDSWDR